MQRSLWTSPRLRYRGKHANRRSPTTQASGAGVVWVRQKDPRQPKLQASLRLLLGCMLMLLLVACAAGPAQPVEAPAEPPQVSPPAGLTATRRPRTPTATADRFVLRPTGTPPPSPTFSLAQVARPPAPDVNPLTGLKLVDSYLLERRPMVVKITNFPRSVRPQWGLTVADHIWEYYLEDELTRFIGVFYGQDAERVGPVRSARPFDEHIFRMYKGIFAFGYADDRVIELWEEADISPLLVIENPDNCPPMCRIGADTNYNTLFTDTALLSQYVSERGVENGRQSLQGLHFDNKSLLLMGGGQALRLDIRYSPSSYNYWQYNESQGRYLRWQDADRRPAGEEVYEPLIDSLTGQQIAADNVVVLIVPTTFFFISNSTEIYDIQFTGKGKGYALRDGKIFAIEWRRHDKNSMLTLNFAGGGPYPLKPGNVWFEVVSDLTTHSVDGQNWRFNFEPPERPEVIPTRTKTKRP